MFRLNRREMRYLDMRGLGTHMCLSYRIARVLGVHFRAGEWGSSRCGSVVTTNYGGRSRYAFVRRFIKVDNKDFASVLWLTKPHYPYAPIPLVVRVRVMTALRQNCMPSLIPLNKIDPTPVLVEPDNNGIHFFMMRVRGWDVLRRY